MDEYTVVELPHTQCAAGWQGGKVDPATQLSGFRPWLRPGHNERPRLCDPAMATKAGAGAFDGFTETKPMNQPTPGRYEQRRPGVAVDDEDPMDVPMEDEGAKPKKPGKTPPGAIAGDGMPSTDADAEEKARTDSALSGPRA